MTGFVVHHNLIAFFPDTWLTYVAMAVGGGVHVFFFLSGFSLMISSAARDSALAFYQKRFIKILIPYYLFITLVFLFNQWVPLYGSDGYYAWLGHILWFKIVDESIFTSFGYQFWSMSVIISFYLCFPWLRLLLLKTGEFYFFAFILMVSMAYWLFLILTHHTESLVHTHFILQYLWEFGLGMTLAHWYKRTGVPFWEQPILLLLAIGVVGMTLKVVLALYGGALGQVINDIPSAIGFAALIVVLFKLAMPALRAVFSWIGTLSYEFYLVHMLAFELVLYLLGNFTPIFNMLLSLPLALAFAVLYAQFSRRVVDWLMPPPAKPNAMA